MTYNPYSGAFEAKMAALRAEAERKEIRKRFGRKISALAIGATAMQFLWAQFLDWGLAGFGIHAGIWAPFWVLEAAGSLIATAVAIGVTSSVRTVREIDHGA